MPRLRLLLLAAVAAPLAAPAAALADHPLPPHGVPPPATNALARNPLAPPSGNFGCPACAQQAAGSSFITALNAGDETPPPVTYTVIETKNDEVVTPYQSAFLAAGDRVTNVLLQDRCPQDPVEHVGT